MSRAELLAWIEQLQARHARSKSQKRQTAEALSDSEERLRAIWNTAVEGIITIDDRGLIEAINPAAEKIFGYAAAELIGQNISVLMPQPHRAAHDGYLANYLHTRPGADHWHWPRGAGPAQGRLRLPHGTFRQRGQASRPHQVHRLHPRHHRPQGIGKGPAALRRAGRILGRRHHRARRSTATSPVGTAARKTFLATAGTKWWANTSPS